MMALREMTYRAFVHASGRVLDAVERSGEPDVVRRRGRRGVLIAPFTSHPPESKLDALTRTGSVRRAARRGPIDWPDVARIDGARLDEILDEMDE